MNEPSKLGKFQKQKRPKEKFFEESTGRKIARPYWNIVTFSEEEGLPPANKHQRLELLKTLNSNTDLSPKLRRLRRKLLLKHMKEVEDPLTNSVVYTSEACVGILKSIKYNNYIQCKFTDRTLKPIIYQNFEIKPPYLSMQEDLLKKVNEMYPSLGVKLKVKKYPINFVYINHEHIEALKSLAELHFWPGIDLSSALDFPEFSCIAVYKKIVIGFGLMSPGQHLNDAYISYLLVRPGWRRCGIATFILYHLTQTCLTWNITLHVSPSNESTILYQKFGFKSHLLLRNFYDKYTPALSNQSKHALYMKLERH